MLNPSSGEMSNKNSGFFGYLCFHVGLKFGFELFRSFGFLRSALISLDVLAFSDRGKILEDQLVTGSRTEKPHHELLLKLVRGR